MKPEKILYVDDEAMALKYFERLVGQIAPVLTATSVEEGKAVLRDHGSEIAVLVTDQRMPGAYGNELLRHARMYHPHIVRMLTTAYSELGDAIEAINTGEIFRYISKPWSLESIRADLRNALELASLRHERDELLRDKMLAQQNQLLASRLGALLMICAAVQPGSQETALHQFAQAALVCKSREPQLDWHRWEHADLLQAEAQRGVAIADHVRQWIKAFGLRSDDSQALSVLAAALKSDLQGSSVVVRDAALLTGLLTAPAGQAVTDVQCAWLAWLLWQEGFARVEPDGDVWRVSMASGGMLPGDWLADAMERLGHQSAQP
ncbi:MAG: response regulator [Burkholderiaceae bacterium]